MFTSSYQVSIVTAVLPTNAAGDTLTALIEDEHVNALVENARGTLLRENWLKAWVPPISPAKTMLQMLVPDQDLDRVLNLIVEHGKLHLQASGAVFSHSADSAYIGSHCHLISPEQIAPAHKNEHAMKSNLQAIYCIVSHAVSDRVAKAAINAGAHGPVVYFAEGRGLRDRLGWLRITKDSEQEVLMIIADNNDVDPIFNAIARAGELHLPGRGFMYRLAINKGMFNLPSRISHQQYDANMQQIINAIDHLSGHTHWRDQAVFNVGRDGKSSGPANSNAASAMRRDQICLTVAVDRDNSRTAMDLLLDSGAPGLSLSYARLLRHESQHLAHGQLDQEYAVMHSVLSQEQALAVSREVEGHADGLGLRDFCVLTQRVPVCANYVPGKKEHREQATPLNKVVVTPLPSALQFDI